MSEEFIRIGNLIYRYYNEGGLNAADSRELNEWLDQSEANRALFERFSDQDYVSEELNAVQDRNMNRDAQWNKLLNIISADPTARPATMPHRIHIGWQRYVAAAAVVVVVAAGAWMWTKYGAANKTLAPVAIAPTPSKDIAPGTNKAILTLSDGSKIVLDSTGNGVIAQQGNARIKKIDKGRLSYDQLAGNELNGKLGSTAFNTLTTPPAAQFQVVLPDGSRVWLNNASSLRYPTSFRGNTREVELSGEAYFEVARNAAKPFKVRVNDMDVDVLGTSFNIMAYKDEAATKTTLLNGIVKVSRGAAGSILRPGEQAQLGTSGLKVAANVNTDAVVAWKNGFFNFNNADIKDVMRHMGRWYDIEVSYEGNVPARSFGGKMGRDLNLGQALEILKTIDINFKVVGRKVIVMP